MRNKSGSRRKRAVLFVLCACVIAAAVGYMAVSNGAFAKWERFDTHEEYAGFFDSPIVEIELQKSTVTKVAFRDAELVDRWAAYFRTLRIKKLYQKTIFDKDVDGGGLYVTVKTEKGNYAVVFTSLPNDDGLKIQIGNAFYAFESEMPYPFHETYDAAAERYGETNLWE